MITSFSDELGEVCFVDETGSTNADLLELARVDAPDGLWLCARRQTAGRGRMGRVWQEVEGNLYASVLTRLQQNDPPPSGLAFVIAVALHRALSDYVGTGAIRLKWPNDVMAGDAKLTGILLERTGDMVVIGAGVNIVGAPNIAGRQTTCLHLLGAEASDMVSVLHNIRRAFAEELQIWRSAGMASIVARWLDRAHPTGTQLSVTLPDGRKLDGQFQTLDESGALILRDTNNDDHVIHAGDVFLT